MATVKALDNASPGGAGQTVTDSPLNPRELVNSIKLIIAFVRAFIVETARYRIVARSGSVKVMRDE